MTEDRIDIGEFLAEKRMSERRVAVKEVPAIEIRHHTTHRVWVFSHDPKEIRNQVNVKRMRWDEKTKKFKGYQREITESHVSAILEYLKSGDAILPNVITLALKGQIGGRDVVFHSSDSKDQQIRAGTLSLPFLFDVSDGKEVGVKDSKDSLAWVVDGQHRLEAISRYPYTPGTFPVLFSAVKTSDLRLQTELFARINMALPVKREAMERILAIVGVKLADRLALRQLAAMVRERMLVADDSPFAELIHR